ncbi:PREDICTED: mitochondrial amidoxime-reducing component 1 [Tarenaya hassleriana]|uniref:mitochondrial amidoxime-reducing component 1 n=1 Tax=Tarenaya hassleriana TaxID=28532 RepID=UPI00053C62DB|nr:PREDICTED: mitochondrial amidoxime-reducing component 1 [Tarenaya hassleriana]
MENVLSPAAELAARVSSLFVYPIKSCRGISLSQAPLTPTGFRWDRNWLIVNSKGRGLTQRVEPKLALIEIEFPEEAFAENWVPKKSLNMVVRAPGMDSLNISLATPKDIARGVSVWEWSGSALDEGEQASQWFTNFLGKPCRLVRFDSASETRPVDPNYAPGHFALFSDMYPFLLLSQGSLDALNKLLKEPVPVNRFRPNIFVDGCEPFAEDLWTEIRINDCTFHGVKLCSRCKVPTIDQETGIGGTEPLVTLRSFRSDKVLQPNRKPQGKIYFGQNMVWKDDETRIGRGKAIEVGDHVFVLGRVTSSVEAAT